MTTEVTQHDSVVVARVAGRVDAYTSPALDQAVAGLPGAGRHLVLDLSGTDYMSSAGLRVLLGLAKRARAEGFQLRLSGLAASVSEVLEIAGFVPLFEIRESEASALAELAAGG